MISDGETPVAVGPYTYDGDSMQALSPATASWGRHHSRVSEVLGRASRAIDRF